jgi:hypothetical protein
MFSLLPPTRAHTFILIFTKPPSSPFLYTHSAHKITNGAYPFGELWANKAISSCSEQHSDIMCYNKNTHQYSAVTHFILGINTGPTLVEANTRVPSFHLKQSACSCLLFVANSIRMIPGYTKHTGIPTDNS